ncbi:hypothetical protein APASM_3244 [Actinosynnema pretiosum subsp. pretiosum]|nr:hypothetical protein APASM_3244 [Actinosynnema pretiosum subsp. pretiosum]
MKVNLPGANAAGVGKATAPGVVAFPSATVSANAVQADENGGVRFFQVLNGPTAPEEFQYTLELPQGSSIVKEVNGSLTVHTSDGDFIVPTPWARDADGRMVWAQYFTDGESTIDLVVNHHGEDLAYPVTADPVWLTPWIVAQIIRCGAGALLGWISSGGWDWWWRALAVAGGCLIGMR